MKDHRLSKNESWKVRQAVSVLHSLTHGSSLGREMIDEPTLRCHHNPLVGALGIQEPVILGEPQVKG